MSGPKRMIVLIIHSLGESGSLLHSHAKPRGEDQHQVLQYRLGRKARLPAYSSGSVSDSGSYPSALFCQCYLLARWGGPSGCLSNTTSSVRYFLLSKGARPADPHWDMAAFVQDSWQSLNGASGWIIYTLLQAGCVVPCPITRGATWLLKLVGTTTSSGN